jgi:hypothetical protein
MIDKRMRQEHHMQKSGVLAFAELMFFNNTEKENIT